MNTDIENAIKLLKENGYKVFSPEKIKEMKEYLNIKDNGKEHS
jgi:biotin operon repressor